MSVKFYDMKVDVRLRQGGYFRHDGITRWEDLVAAGNDKLCQAVWDFHGNKGRVPLWFAGEVMAEDADMLPAKWTRYLYDLLNHKHEKACPCACWDEGDVAYIDKDIQRVLFEADWAYGGSH